MNIPALNGFVVVEGERTTSYWQLFHDKFSVAVKKGFTFVRMSFMNNSFHPFNNDLAFLTRTAQLSICLYGFCGAR